MEHACFNLNGINSPAWKLLFQHLPAQQIDNLHRLNFGFARINLQKAVNRVGVDFYRRFFLFNSCACGPEETRAFRSPGGFCACNSVQAPGSPGAPGKM
ncbi:MAG: hypothetical protein R3D58_20030 [Saprospiraceae bacterium]